MGNHDPLMAPHNTYRCGGDDDWVVIACANDDDWRKLVSVIAPELVGDPQLES